jgi:hypothetical protein
VVVDLARERARRAELSDELPRLPLVIQASQRAVSLVLPGRELWITPRQARELAEDLSRAATEANCV